MKKRIIAIGSIVIGLGGFAVSRVNGQTQVSPMAPIVGVGNQAQQSPGTFGLSFESQHESPCGPSTAIPDCLRQMLSKVKNKKSEVSAANEKIKFEVDRLGKSIQVRQEEYRQISSDFREAEQLWRSYGREGRFVRLGDTVVSSQGLRKRVEELSEQQRVVGSELRFLKSEYDELKRTYDLYNIKSRKLDLAIEIIPSRIVLAERGGIQQEIRKMLADLSDLLNFTAIAPREKAAPARSG